MHLRILFAALFALTCAATPHAASASNAISGKVVVKKKDGEAVKDASNIVVFVDGLKQDAANGKGAMASRNKVFDPLILPIVKGSEVEFPNDDVILHNVFSLSKTKPFDLGLYKKGDMKMVRFDQPGLVKVYCNIHEKMAGYILVLENPYFALTDKDGNFKISGVPNGKYMLSSWHRYGDMQKKEIELTGSGQVKVGFDLVKGDEIAVEIVENGATDGHLNKWGQPYKSKY